MNEVQRAVDAENENRALTEAQNNYASVSQQIQELDQEDAQSDMEIAKARAIIQSEQQAKRLRREERVRLNRRRRVFYNARHQLKMIDEGL